MTTAIIIQARMGSTRLPGKMMMNVAGIPLNEYVISRVKQSQKVNTIILATGNGNENAILLQEAARQGIVGFAGSEDDVLDRYYQAALLANASIVVRITGDCPFIDPTIIDAVISLFENSNVDYISTNHPATFPDGYDVEVFSSDAMEKAWKEATIPSDREHVTPYIWRNDTLFTKINYAHNEDLSSLRVTIDEPEDLEFVNKILKLTPIKNHRLTDIISVIRAHPELTQINNEFERNEGYARSLAKDQEFSQVDDRKKWIRSTSLLARAKKLIPTASQTYSKSYNYFCEGASPAFLAKGKNGYVWDVDRNQFIDFVLGLGPITIGYANEEVNNAIINQLSNGISFSLPIELELKLAEKLIEIIPCAEMVKFVKNGSDATAAAVRLARAYTGKEVVLCSGYHGYQDWYIGSTENNKGVPVDVQKLVKKFEYNNIESVKKLFEDHQGDVAAVILEPCQAEGPNKGFLEKLKELTHQYGALLIFDEVVSGFRMALGGAQEVYAITPDLASFGKGIANGASLSIIAGRADIMKLIDHGVFISTTFGGEATCLAAALKTIEILERPNSFPHILSLGNKWINAIKQMIEEKGLREYVEVYGVSPHAGPTFKTVGPIHSHDLFTIYQQTLIENNILSVGVNNFCLTHTDEDIQKLIDAANKGLDLVAQAIKTGDPDSLIKGEKFRPIFGRRSS